MGWSTEEDWIPNIEYIGDEPIEYSATLNPNFYVVYAYRY